jgi:hypothetical protein
LLLNLHQKTSKFLRIPLLWLFFSLASVVVDLLARFCDISLNKSLKADLGPL